MLMGKKKRSQTFINIVKDNKAAVIRFGLVVLFVIIVFVIAFNTGWLDLLGIICSVFGVISVIISGIVWYNTARLLSKKKEMRVDISSNDLILIVSLAKRIESDVRNYIVNSERFPKLDKIEVVEGRLDFPDHKYMNLELVENLDGALCISKLQDMGGSEQEISDYLEEFRKCIKSVSKITEQDNNVGKIHVFFSGPAEMAAYIMPYFVNKKTIVMYRYDMNSQSYICIGPVEER